MATLEKAEELLEQLRGASYDAAKRDLQDIKDFAAEQGFTGELAQVGDDASKLCTHAGLRFTALARASCAAEASQAQARMCGALGVRQQAGPWEQGKQSCELRG